ncbi:MAG: hypothetical protein V7676_07610 [Parasphingorhabdus sp.]|uniref:hypothetical protein n=1 Tax=Parasphingorhabdus sp. TaxID=2709688 RepID=UPI003001481C
MKHILSLVPFALLAACSSQSAPDADPVADDLSSAAPPAPEASVPEQTAPVPTQSTNILSLTGLGDLRIGEPVPATSNWSARGAQASDECIIMSSPDYAGAYAIVEGGAVQRISIGDRSPVKLAQGIGPGASEAAAKKYFPFPETPHKYEDAPAKYLTAPNADSGDAALRIEIGSDGKVSVIHVGTMPVLAYVEACS